VTPPGAGRWLLAGVLAVSGCGSVDGLRGAAVVVQDVEGLGEQGLERGWVVAVPAASVDALWAGEDVPSDVELPHVSVPMSRAQVEAVSGVVGAIDDGDSRSTRLPARTCSASWRRTGSASARGGAAGPTSRRRVGSR
jgi:hypothetical protein